MFDFVTMFFIKAGLISFGVLFFGSVIITLFLYIIYRVFDHGTMSILEYFKRMF